MKKNINEVVAGNLRTLMDEREMVQTELARKSGVPQTTISLYLNPARRKESATGKPPSGKLVEIEAMANALGVPVQQLISLPGSSATANGAARPAVAEALADALGDALQGLPAAMYARSVDACRRLAEAPDSNRARTEMWDVLQHSDALRSPPVPPKSAAPIDKAFREAFYALLDEGPDSKARAIVNELRDAIEQRVASELGIDRKQAQRALAARQ